MCYNVFVAFEKGHPYLPPKGENKAGRKQLPKNKIKDALRKAEGTLPKLLKTLEEIALGYSLTCEKCGHVMTHAKPDREAVVALMNRIAGLPTAKHELDITTKLQLTAEECRAIAEYAIAAIQEQQDIPALEGEYKLLAEHSIQSPELGRTIESSAVQSPAQEQVNPQEHTITGEQDVPVHILPHTNESGVPIQEGELPYVPPAGGEEGGVSSEGKCVTPNEGIHPAATPLEQIEVM